MEQSFPTRRQMIQGMSMAAAAATVAPLIRCGQANRPNILWLISEDTSPDMACYGHPLVQTPNIDRLASEGVRYTSAFTTAPVCSASRSGFMTGMYQTTIGAHQHDTLLKQPLPDGIKVITEYFRQAGYFTSNARGPELKSKGKTHWNFTYEGEPFDGIHWNERKPGQPFFSQVNFSMTHRAFQRDPERPIDPNRVEIPPYYPDHPITRRDWADYLESIQVLDRHIGEVLEQLKTDGLLENTIIFYFGDHGQPHVRSKQWLYEGGIHIPLIVRMPGMEHAGQVDDQLISAIDFAPTAMRMAGIEPPAHLHGRNFFGPDAEPEPEYIFAARDRCDETFDRIRCVRNKRYKLIRNYHPELPYTQMNVYKRQAYPVVSLLAVLYKQQQLTPVQARWMAPTRPPEELYDLQSDPHEINNLAGNPDMQPILTQLQGALDAWVRETSDKGEFPEPPEEMQHWAPFMKSEWDKWMKAKGLSPDITDEEYLQWWIENLL